MNLRIFGEPEPESAPADTGNRLLSHIEHALALGYGGAAAWAKMDVEQNLVAVEAELQSISVDAQKLAQRTQQRAAEGMNDAEGEAEHSADAHLVQQRLELHVWRRCLHLSQRLGRQGAHESVNIELVERFLSAVLHMRQLFADHTFGEGQLFLRGIRISHETIHEIMQVCSWQHADGSEARRELRHARGG